jgi:hypothetical protein
LRDSISANLRVGRGRETAEQMSLNDLNDDTIKRKVATESVPDISLSGILK